MYKAHTPVFRTAISGFNKTDVNMYIAKLARDFGEQSEQMKNEIAELKVKLPELEEKAGTAERTAAELESANAAIAEKDAQLEAFKAENERIKSELKEALSLINGARDSVKTILEELEATADAAAEKIGTVTNG